MGTADTVWAIALIAVGLIGYAYGWYSHPKHRKGCNECDAVLRREAEAQREMAHDADHRGFKAPGFPPPTRDTMECADPGDRKSVV